MRNNVVFKVGLSLFFFFVAVGCVLYYFIYFPNVTVKDEGIVYIRDGNTFDDVARKLEENGYIRNTYTFRRLAAVKQYPRLIKSGRYRLRDRMSNNELVNMLRSGAQETVNITFNNIRTFDQLASLLSRNLAVDSLRFMELVQDREMVTRLGFTTDNFIGMFIPNTYQVYWSITAEGFINRMHKEYERFWNDTRKAKVGQIGFSPMDVIVLASIVEEETANPDEYEIIAGVYVNRLRKGIPLCACPTLRFSLGDFTIRRVLEKHTRIESPYNTYKYKGLPPGPIRMPSLQVVNAVLNYREHDYLYFCAKSDFSGTHHFSKTLRQHNKYAREYHKALDRNKIYR